MKLFGVYKTDKSEFPRFYKGQVVVDLGDWYKDRRKVMDIYTQQVKYIPDSCLFSVNIEESLNDIR